MWSVCYPGRSEMREREERERGGEERKRKREPLEE